MTQENWRLFRTDLEARTNALLEELNSAWEDMESAAAAVGMALDSGLDELASGSIAEAARFLEGPGDRLLKAPINALQRKRPLLRSLNAFETWMSSVADLSRQLPLKAEISRAECAGWAGLSLPFWRVFGSSSPREVPLRFMVMAEASRLELERSRLDGDWQLLMARMALRIPAAWQAVRRDGLARVAGYPVEGRLRDELAEIRQSLGRWKDETLKLLAEYRVWATSAVTRINRCLLGSTTVSERTRDKRVEKRSKYFAYWSRQQRAIQAWLDVQLQFHLVGVGALQEAARAVVSIEAEYGDLSSELDSVLDWLKRWDAGDEVGSFPNPHARLLSADERAGELVRRVSDLSRRRMPMVIESIQPSRALPGWREPWRRLEPQRLLESAMDSTARRIALGGLREAEAAHGAMVREIERAREVVAFGFEQAPDEGGENELAREAAANAIGLLTYQKENAPGPRAALEPVLLQALAAAFAEAHLGLDKGRLGLLAHATRKRGTRALNELAALGLAWLRGAVVKSYRGLHSLLRWFLLKSGLSTPPVSHESAVDRRPHLGDALTMLVGERDLPMLYKRLFRLAPVEDPRFLIGRDVELGGLQEAVRHWASGRHASVLIIGARGSGKTSLLNCAVTDTLASLPVCRGSFRERIRTPEQLHSFLKSLAGIESAGDLKDELRATRRILIIEELERTALGVIGGYSALRELMGLIEDTCDTTLWVLALNEIAYRHLNAAAGLGAHFSHRINAMSVPKQKLADAILYRHHLSGMRLQFAPLPSGDKRVRKLRHTLGLEKDPQEIFFDSLYEQSEGIFRSAFELWQDSIERVEGGIVHIRQPLDPDYGPLMDEMKQPDQFLVRGVLRHGSLTAAEAAELFAATESSMRRSMERLDSLHVLEPDPTAPGWRVKPQAGRVVRELLFRANLH